MPWNPSPHATHVEAVFDPDAAGPVSLLVEHFNDPYEVALNDDGDRSLREAAHAYLRDLVGNPQIAGRFRVGFPQEWMTTSAPGDGDPSGLAWLPLGAPHGSFRFRSRSDDLVALFASGRQGALHVGPAFGLAVTMRIRKRDDGGTAGVFVGMAASLPRGPYAPPAPKPAPVLPAIPAGPALHVHRMATARVFDNDPSSLRGLPVSPTRNEDLVPPGQAPAQPPAGPISLDGFRVDRGILPSGTGPLEYPTGPTPLIKVMPCGRYVAADRASTRGRPAPVATPPSGPPVRSNEASAIQAFFHARDLVQRLEAYGWSNAASYFRITKPEVQIYYRSGISPGPGKDGRTVNARVIPEGWPINAIGIPAGTAQPSAIQIHLAGADLRRRARDKWSWGGLPTPAIPFGLAADKRWMWHEFGHVLLVASTGELEFRFAHSPGDAMAAIVADPESNLPPRLRGSTFPFVFLPRYHDRCAAHGWSWSGTMHEGLANVPAAKHPRRKGYASEQILSSSLFRLYRCIGGDTCKPGSSERDTRQRLRASHYTLYLIMQAMQLMGDARIQATSTPAKFVHWLKQADRQTGRWSATLPPAQFRRVGGTLAKVIRWAFEAQGLYGDGNGPGSPEPVDIYIEDSRSTTECGVYDDPDQGRGSYVPVSLHWQSGGGEAAPPWQAHPTTGVIFSRDTGQVEVRVGNRGTDTARDVEVRLWYAAWPRTARPLWIASPGAWTECPAAAAQDIRPGPPSAANAFTFAFNPGGTGRYILFAQATCPDDRAISDPALGLACSSRPTPLADLVANDNNLALLVVHV